MDGGYPSFISPGCDQGHLGLSGYVFLLKGNPLADRRFVSREFTIRPPGRCHRAKRGLWQTAVGRIALKGSDRALGSERDLSFKLNDELRLEL